MKLDRLFEVKGGKLFKISGEEYPVSEKNVLPIKWSDVEGAPEEYSEEFLAKTRDGLKALEEKNEFVFIEPVFDKEASVEQFTAAMKHTARRIKDCVSVIGFAIPKKAEAQKDFFIEELSAKHQHYCFFSKSLKEDSIVCY